MRISAEDIKEKGVKLAESKKFLSSQNATLQEQGLYLLQLGKALEISSSIVEDAMMERLVLYRALINLMLDSGVYDFTLTSDDSSASKEYQLEIDSTENSITFSLKFPQNISQEGQ